MRNHISIRCGYFPPQRLRGLYITFFFMGQFHIETNTAPVSRKMTLFHKTSATSISCLFDRGDLHSLPQPTSKSSNVPSTTRPHQWITQYRVRICHSTLNFSQWNHQSASRYWLVHGKILSILEWCQYHNRASIQTVLWFDHVGVFCDISNRPDLRAYELRDVFGSFNRSLHAHQISEGTAQFRLAGRYEFRLFEGRYSASACYTCKPPLKSQSDSSGPTDIWKIYYV